MWQLKWELEDLSFRFLEPELYKRIAQMLDEKRLERERYIANAMDTLARELGAVHVKAQITGRPKHIYSIWNKMRTKQLDFSELYDVRALRVIVPEVKDCYAALGVAQPLAADPEGVRRLHLAPEGQPLPVAAHRGGRPGRQDAGSADPHRGDAPPGRVRRRRPLEYKEEPRQKLVASVRPEVAWLRQLLAWRDEVPRQEAELDDLYVLTPQGKVIDLPAGSTPIDFAYALHSDLGHRCRGARRRAHRQARHAARERPARRDRRGEERRPVARLAQPRARLREERARAPQDPAVVQRQGARRDRGRGRAVVEKELRREGATQASLEGLAAKLGFRQARRALPRWRATRSI